jgi:hypothetical protein
MANMAEKHSVPEEKIIQNPTQSFDLGSFDSLGDTENVKTSAPKKVKWGD